MSFLYANEYLFLLIPCTLSYLCLKACPPHSQLCLCALFG